MTKSICKAGLLFCVIMLAGTKAFCAEKEIKSSINLSTWSLKKIKEKFRIGYFSETVGPSLARLDDNEVADDGSKLRQPTTMYHSFDVRYLIGQKFNFFLSPRFNTAFGDRNDLRDNEESRNFYSDDWLVGFLYNVFRNSSTTYRQRLTHRHPFSLRSKTDQIQSQIEWQHFMSYAFTPSLRLLWWNNYRYYAYENVVNSERYRINFRTLLNYTLSDKWNLQFSHELDLQHRNPKSSSDPKHQELTFLKRYRNYFNFGVGYSPIRDLTLIPYLRLLDERNIRNETTVVGLWMLGRVL